MRWLRAGTLPDQPWQPGAHPHEPLAGQRAQHQPLDGLGGDRRQHYGGRAHHGPVAEQGLPGGRPDYLLLR
ncbi:MAG: hypothetical protein K6A67_09385 [Bacteroidales bacterium]|nr:hypothetical protein [Bacteroidales bacterium]